jgi:hypothetical protein
MSNWAQKEVCDTIYHHIESAHSCDELATHERALLLRGRVELTFETCRVAGVWKLSADIGSRELVDLSSACMVHAQEKK